MRSIRTGHFKRPAWDLAIDEFHSKKYPPARTTNADPLLALYILHAVYERVSVIRSPAIVTVIGSKAKHLVAGILPRVAGIDTYEIWRDLSGLVSSWIVESTRVVISNLTPGATYEHKVRKVKDTPLSPHILTGQTPW